MLRALLLLQDALQLDGDAAGGGSVGEIDADGSDLDDLDDYINKLDAGAMEYQIKRWMQKSASPCLELRAV
jgi:hypothetical protein